MTDVPSTGDWLKDGARAGGRYHYRHKVPWRHNAIGIVVLAAVLIAGAGLLELSRGANAWAYVPAAGVGFGLLFYTLLGIPVHEASHGMMFLSRDPARRKRWNTLIGWLCALPFGIHYRRHWAEGHVTHHIHPIEDDDPQAYNRSTGPALARVVMLLLLVPGAALVHRFTVRRQTGFGGSSPSVFGAFAAIWLVGVTATVAVYGWPAAFALVYGLQVLAALNQVKGALEHGGEIAFDPDRLLRSRSSLFPFCLLLPMFYVTIFHFEHHLNYAVPWYDLPRYHHDVGRLMPESLQPDVFNRELLAQLAGHKGRIGRTAPLT
ncbi:MAG: fatty acid desaturase [Vicinamibacterales bacterium]